jgi:hypothetical protein
MNSDFMAAHSNLESRAHRDLLDLRTSGDMTETALKKQIASLTKLRSERLVSKRRQLPDGRRRRGRFGLVKMVLRMRFERLPVSRFPY